MPSENISGNISFTPEDLQNGSGLAGAINLTGEAASVLRQAAAGPTQVTLTRSTSAPTQDQILWTAIRNRTDAIGFNRYNAFIERLLCERGNVGEPACGAAPNPTPGQVQDLRAGLGLGSLGAPSLDERIADLASRPGIYGPDTYQLLKLATHAFLLLEGGVSVDPPRFGAAPATPGALLADEASRLGRPITLTQAREQLTEYLQTQIGTLGGSALPYLKRVVEALIGVGARDDGSPFCADILRSRVRCPALIELIWNYWNEQGCLVQTMNAIMLRFQNRRRGPLDPLANLAFSGLQPLANLLWGRIEDEPRQLSVARRAHNYDYEYGLKLYGKAVADIAPVESRSKFLQAFHNLLHETADFYDDDAITTVVADGFPLLQSLKELHLVLAESANNQFDELKRQARVEMMIDQYLLARREMVDVLRGRVMVPYPEPWMPQVDSMKRLQGWPEDSVSHFHYLAVVGEKILLSVRYGDWTGVIDQTAAVNWARYWRPEIQTYLHSYAAVTGVDLTVDTVDMRRADDRYLQPSAHLRDRLLAQQGRTAIGYQNSDRGYVAEELLDAEPVRATTAPRLARRTRSI